MNADTSANGCYLARAVSFVLLLISLNAFAADEETLGALQIGDQTYHDVTVRTKAKDYIFIAHSSGMTSIKVTQLPNEVCEKLGYAVKKDTVPVLTPKNVVHRGLDRVAEMKAQMFQAWQRTGLAPVVQQFGTVNTVIVVVAALLIVHLFSSCCCLLICQKVGMKPGVLVWLPVLQAVPMLGAASMSIMWFGALFIPGLNLWAWVLWCLKIVRARQKTMPLAILLLCPLTSWFGFLFLAFSRDNRDDGTKVRVEAMTFQSVCGSAKPVGLRALLQSEHHVAA